MPLKFLLIREVAPCRVPATFMDRHLSLALPRPYAPGAQSIFGALCVRKLSRGETRALQVPKPWLTLKLEGEIAQKNCRLSVRPELDARSPAAMGLNPWHVHRSFYSSRS